MASVPSIASLLGAALINRQNVIRPPDIQGTPLNLRANSLSPIRSAIPRIDTSSGILQAGRAIGAALAQRAQMRSQQEEERQQAGRNRRIAEALIGQPVLSNSPESIVRNAAPNRQELARLLTSDPTQDQARQQVIDIAGESGIDPAVAVARSRGLIREPGDIVTFADRQGNILGQAREDSDEARQLRNQGGLVVNQASVRDLRGDQNIRTEDFTVLTNDGQRIPVQGANINGRRQIFNAQGELVDVEDIFPNAVRIEPEITRQRQGELAELTESQLGRVQSDINERVAALNTFGARANRILKIIEQQPGANTLTATLANVGNRIANEARTLADDFNVEFESGEDVFNPDRFADAFAANGLAGASARTKNGFLGLAINRAIASGLGTGRALSDFDIKQQLQTLGANQSDPAIIRQIFVDSFANLSDGVRFSAQVTQGVRLPEIQSPEFLNSNDDSKSVDLRALSVDQLEQQLNQALEGDDNELRRRINQEIERRLSGQ